MWHLTLKQLRNATNNKLNDWLNKKWINNKWAVKTKLWPISSENGRINRKGQNKREKIHKEDQRADHPH